MQYDYKSLSQNCTWINGPLDRKIIQCNVNGSFEERLMFREWFLSTKARVVAKRLFASIWCQISGYFFTNDDELQTLYEMFW